MKTALTSMLLAAAVVAAPAAHAGSRSATMQVSFTIVESCNVQANAQAQSVKCDLATPYQISRPAAPAAQAAATAVAADADAKVVTITF